VPGPGRFAGAFAVKEEDIGFDSLGIEDARRQPQEGVDIAFLEQAAAYGLASSAFKSEKTSVLTAAGFG
jgi:hypothetical protein